MSDRHDEEIEDLRYEAEKLERRHRLTEPTPKPTDALEMWGEMFYFKPGEMTKAQKTGEAEVCIRYTDMLRLEAIVKQLGRVEEKKAALYAAADALVAAPLGKPRAVALHEFYEAEYALRESASKKEDAG